MNFRAGQYQFSFPRAALVMGVVNVTPDSFSDGGRFFHPESAVAHGLALVEQGAEILDIGGESTRPNASIVSPEEELRRVIPVIKELSSRVKVPISIDTYKSEVAIAALEAGASIVNDVRAWEIKPELYDHLRKCGAGYIAMHMQGTPQTMQQKPHYENVVEEIQSFFRERLQALRQAGLSEEQIIFDPGIGFGKTLEHNLQLMRHLGRFKEMARPLLLGVSRKSFIGKVTGTEMENRLPGTLACTVWAVLQGVQVIRAHDVAATFQTVRMLEAIVNSPA
ncbi:MAG: dihydropteroate synthase [Verrucomicrobiota bacterium]|nr:dihydropteroate synthase [Verrucomicrobiota bacterium]